MNETLASRVARLETFRDDTARPRLHSYGTRIRALELSWAKLLGASALGSILGGGAVAVLINKVGG